MVRLETMERPVIEIKNLTKKFDNKIVIGNLDLKVYKGEFFGLLGPNGAGKTVLINLLLGMILADWGKIKVFGKDLQENLNKIRQKINFSSTYSQLQGHATIYENLLTFSRLYGVKNPEKKIKEVLEFFELEDYVKRGVKIWVLSSGELTKVMLAKALLNNPEILFLDEPTANLDPIITQKVQEHILKLHRLKKVTIFYTSHNLQEVRRLCTRIAFLKKGRILKIIDNKKKNLNLKKLMKLYQG